MPQAIVDEPALHRFKSALVALYGTRLAGAVLFGSRARGDARPDSGYDIAVFLKDLGSDFLDETGALFEAWPLPAGLPEDAGRAAYVACFRRAQARIFEAYGRVVKTHSGVWEAQTLNQIIT